MQNKIWAFSEDSCQISYRRVQNRKADKIPTHLLYIIISARLVNTVQQHNICGKSYHFLSTIKSYKRTFNIIFVKIRLLQQEDKSFPKGNVFFSSQQQITGYYSNKSESIGLLIFRRCNYSKYE